MKHSQLALAAALAASCAGVQAQSGSNVQLYGLLDAGLEHLNNTNSAQQGMWKVTSGGMNTSRWGLRGSEDLGDGLHAIFNLEGGLFLDTGTQDSVLFKRASVVGLENANGSVVIGRAFTTVYDFLITLDPMGYSPAYSWVLSGNAAGVSKYGMTTSFDNLVKYTGKFGALKVGVTYGLGEQPEGAASGRKYAIGTLYADGGIAVAATYEHINGNLVGLTGNRDATKALHLAASYALGDYKATLGARDFKLSAGKANTAELQARVYWAGLAYKLTPAATLIGAYYYQDVRNVAPGADADPRMVVLRAKYALSPRTDLYTTLGRATSKNGKAVSLSRDDTAPCDSQTGFIAGIQHRF